MNRQPQLNKSKNYKNHIQVYGTPIIGYEKRPTRSSYNGLATTFLGETDQPRLNAWNKHSQVQLITLAFITSYSVTIQHFLAPLSLDHSEHLSPVLVSLKLQMHHSQV